MSAHARRRDVAGVAVLIAAAVVFVVEPFHGAVLLSASGSHGLDLGDLVALPLLLLGGWLLAGGSARDWPRIARAACEDRGVDLVGAGLVTAGAGFVLAAIFREVDVSARVAHAGALPLTVLAIGLVMLGLALAEPGAARATFGTGVAVLGAVLLAGFLVDATDGPAGSVVGATFLALALAVTLGRDDRVARWVMSGLAACFVVVDLAALVDVRFLEADRELGGGGLARSAALGLVLVAVGVLRLRDAHEMSRAGAAGGPTPNA